MIAYLLDGQLGTVETFCPADEEARDMSGADRVDLPGNRAILMVRKATTGATSAGSSF
jgi:hypothetical protein